MSYQFRPYQRGDETLLQALEAGESDGFKASPEHSLIYFLMEAGSALAYVEVQVVLDELNILRVLVHPQHRRKGLGLVLLNHVFELWKHCRKIHLEVSVQNAPALALYRKLGFIEAGVRPQYYRDGSDALFMTK